VTTGLPCAVVYGLYRALPGEPAFATVAAAQPLEPSRRLDACMCASEPHDFAVRGRCRTSIGTTPSTAFRTTFVTTRTPLVAARSGRKKAQFLKQRNRNIFAPPVLNAATGLMRFTKFDFSRTRCLIALAKRRLDAMRRNRSDLPVGCAGTSCVDDGRRRRAGWSRRRNPPSWRFITADHDPPYEASLPMCRCRQGTRHGSVFHPPVALDQWFPKMSA
jgi:hypothetical protein